MRTVDFLKATVEGMLSVAIAVKEVQEAREFVVESINDRSKEIQILKSEIKELQRLLDSVNQKWDEFEGEEDLECEVDSLV